MKKWNLLIVAALMGAAALASCTNAILDGGSPTSVLEAADRSATASAAPIRLLIAQPEILNYAGQVLLTAHAKNLGSANSRIVSAHYRTGTTWTTTPMNKAADYGSHSLYSLIIPGSLAEFALKFQSDSGIWWDNNGGANYKVTAENAVNGYQPGAIGGNIGLRHAMVGQDILIDPNFTYIGGKVNLSIAVEDLSYNKKVGVRFSTNGGPWIDFDATFSHKVTSGQANKVEYWSAEIKGLPLDPAQSFRFALYYKNLDTGKTYWDNNFTQDYQTTLVNCNTIQ